MMVLAVESVSVPISPSVCLSVSISHLTFSLTLEGLSGLNPTV